MSHRPVGYDFERKDWYLVKTGFNELFWWLNIGFWCIAIYMQSRRHLAQSHYLCLNTLRPRQNGRHFADYTFKRIFVNENVRISIEISLKFVPRGPINNIPALVQIMAWCRPGDKPLSEPVMVSLLTHICVTRPQWVKSTSCYVQSPRLSPRYTDREGLHGNDLPLSPTGFYSSWIFKHGYRLASRLATSQSRATFGNFCRLLRPFLNTTCPRFHSWAGQFGVHHLTLTLSKGSDGTRNSAIISIRRRGYSEIWNLMEFEKRTYFPHHL